MSDLRTPLHAWHVARKARMVPFAGWDMPVQYTGIIEEHTAVRASAGLFDIGHMARLSFTGPDALPFLELVFTNSVGTMKVGQVRYGLLLNDRGGILDDILVYRFSDHYEAVVNAGNREKILVWLATHLGSFDCAVRDHTFETAMVAIQGPRSSAMVQSLLADDVGALKYYTVRHTTWSGHAVAVSRTGYTGEDGFEIVIVNALAVALWEALIAKGAVPCGLGARDTLRLEAAMPLYGHELSEAIDPLQAKLDWAVKMDKGDFLGRAGLLNRLPSLPERTGILLEGKRAARQGAMLFAEGSAIGEVTSGSYVPHLQRSIAMAYLPTNFTPPGTELLVDLRGAKVPAKVVPLPFYTRPKV
jgi:aminomethyltransferase